VPDDRADDSDLQKGDRVDNYIIQDKLGDGGFATVYKARHSDSGQTVALKMLNAEAALDKNVLRRFLREAEASNLIDHPNIVQVLAFGDHARQPFLVMEFLPGENLAERIKRRGAMPVKEAVPLLIDVCQALARAHDANIVHRDIKPENLFLTNDSVKVLDFGIAKFQQQQPGEMKTATRAILGTLHTMSPEQCRSSKIDARSDIYSLGVVAYFMLAGEYPFAHAHDLEIAVAHLKEQPRPLTEKNPAVPSDVAAIVMRCLQKDPGARYRSMRELRDAFSATQDFDRKKSRWPLYAAAFALLSAAAAWYFLAH
jgi:serine/threonine-protein kinase